MSKLYERYKDCDQIELYNELLRANLRGDLEVVKYLTSSPELPIHADIHLDDEAILRKACDYNNFDIVKYLLTSPLLKSHADINAYYGGALANACGKENIELVRYLLTSSELKEHAYVNNWIFQDLCRMEKYETLKYLIFDYGLEETYEFKDILDSEELPGAKAVKAMFEKRDLANSLQKELLLNENTHKKKPKI